MVSENFDELFASNRPQDSTPHTDDSDQRSYRGKEQPEITGLFSDFVLRIQVDLVFSVARTAAVTGWRNRNSDWFRLYVGQWSGTID